MGVDGVLLALPGTESDIARSPSWIVWTVGFGNETLARRLVPSDCGVRRILNEEIAKFGRELKPVSR